MANLYNKAGLVNIPIGYSDGFLYNIKPVDDTLAFRFNRDSAATRVNKEGLIEQVGYFGPELVQNGDFSELGPELITNGDFATDSDWILGNGWSISDGKAILVDGLDPTYQIYQLVSGLNTKNLKVTFDVTDFSGNAELRYPFRGNITGNGSYTFYGVGTLDRVQFQVKSGFTASFSIDNVSVKQVDPNDYWTVGSSWSFGNNKIIGGGTGIFRPTTNSWTSGGKFLFKLKISDRTSGYIRIQNPAVTVYYVNNIDENGELEFIFDSIDNTGWAIEAQGGFNGSITDISVTEILGDKPRIDYTDSLTSPSFLLEPQRTNLVTFSEDFTQWTAGSNTSLTFVSDVVAPDGSLGVYRLTLPATSDTYLLSNSFSTQNPLTLSIYAKSVNTNNNFNFFTGVGNPSPTKTASDEWQRFDYVSNGDEFVIVNFGDTFETDIYIWGAQAEAGSYATSYIPTAGSTITRAGETCNGAGNASTFSDSEGVLYAEIAALANDGNYRRLGISDGTTLNRVIIGFTPSSNTIQGFTSGSGSTQSNMSYTVSDATAFNKIAIKYKVNDFAFWINGTRVDTDGSGTAPSGLLEAAFNQGGGVYDFYGKTKGVYVFNEALTDDELQQLTGPEYNSFAALAAAYNYTVI